MSKVNVAEIDEVIEGNPDSLGLSNKADDEGSEYVPPSDEVNSDDGVCMNTGSAVASSKKANVSSKGSTPKKMMGIVKVAAKKRTPSRSPRKRLPHPSDAPMDVDNMPEETVAYKNTHPEVVNDRSIAQYLDEKHRKVLEKVRSKNDVYHWPFVLMSPITGECIR